MGWLLQLITGNPVTLIYLSAGIFLAGLAAGGSGAWWVQGLRLDSAKAETKTVQAAFSVFKTQVAAEGKIAQQKADTQAAADKQRAKEADDEAKKRYSSLDAQYSQYRMRQRAGSGATSRIVPPAATGTPSGSAICYTREKLDSEISGAVGRLRAGLADDAEPYDKAAVVARICRDWALR